MGMIADVILPVFCVPYCLPFVLPLAGFGVLAAEVVAFKLLNRHLGIGTIVGVVILANVVSTIVGFLIAGIALPSGYVWNVVETGDRPTRAFERGQLFDTYLYLSFFVAFVLSVVIEYPIVRACAGWAKVDRPLMTVVLANVASYITLAVVALISF
jgi:hypothetical protein